MKDSIFKITVTNPGLQVEVRGDLDDIAHGIAEAMNQNDAIKELFAHAMLINMKEKMLSKSQKVVEKSVETKKKEKVIN